MEHTDFSEMRCSIARTVDLIGDGWSPLILRDLYLGVQRFDELVEDLGISRNLLTRRLAALVNGGIVERTPYQTRPMRYDYKLSPAGVELAPLLVAITAWGDRWAPLPEGPPILFAHKSCGCRFTPRLVCSECREDLQATDIRALPGPGGAPTRGTRVLARRLSAAG